MQAWVIFYFLIWRPGVFLSLSFIVMGRQETSKLETGNRPWRHKVKSRPRLLLL